VSSHLPVDQARLRPHLRERARLEGQEAAVLQRESSRAAADGVDLTAPSWKTPGGDDLERLRGLPAIGRNVSGRIKGTDPVRELLRKDR
jgi:hypothetical protein